MTEAWKKHIKNLRFRNKMCTNCGEKGPHFVPPSIGEEGFYMCVETYPTLGMEEFEKNASSK